MKSIIELAKEAGFEKLHIKREGQKHSILDLCYPELERFADLVREQTLKEDKDMTLAYMVGYEKGKDQFRDATKMLAEPVKRPQNCGTGYCSCIECPYEPVKQEPVAWGCRFQDGSIHDCICPESHDECEGDYNIPLFTFPVDAKALREALAEQADQEPVAWLVQYKDCHTFVWGRKPEFIVDGVVEPLYVAPVRTKDLTDVEVEKVWRKHGGYMVMPIDFARAVIAADREKNK